VNLLDLDEYYIACVSEIVGVEYKDFHIFGACTHSHLTAPILFDALCEIRESDKYAEKTSVFLMDANAHHVEWLGSKETDDAGDCALAFSEIYDIKQYVDFPTRGVNILDLVYSDLACETSALPHLGTSDHLTVLVKVDLSLDVPAPPPNRAVFHWASAPWNHIRGELSRQFQGWDARSFESVDDAVTAYYKIVDTVIKRYVRSSIPRGARPTPWWDRHCSLAQQHTDSAFAHRESNPEGYKSARAVLKTRQRQAYARYRTALRHKVAQQNSGKEWWDVIKLHYGTGGSHVSGAPSPEKLAKFFAEKLSLGGEENDPVPEFAPVEAGKLNSFRVSHNRVKKVLKGLNPYKSVNGISNRFLKSCANVLAAPTTSLFQRVARDAIWPTIWKEGRVSAIWKRSIKSMPKNYRPVTVLDCLSLCMERTLDPQLDNFLNPFIPGSQYGFKKRCGAQDYGATVCMKLHAALEAGFEAILVSLDVAGAFDKVWWKALLANLKHCGMGGRSHKLITRHIYLPDS
jgi:hypothetical protein